MRTYDGLTHRIRHTDADVTAGQRHVARLLGLQAAPEGSMWEMSLSAGGIGILDTLALAVPAASIDFPALARHLHLRTVAELDQDDLAWLVAKDEDQSMDEAVAAFLADQRRPCQPSPSADVWFAAESGVNHWEVVWVADGLLAFLQFDQG